MQRWILNLPVAFYRTESGEAVAVGGRCPHRHFPLGKRRVEGDLSLQTDLGARDLLGSITGVGDFDQVRESAVEVDIFGRKVKVIGLDQLIKAKEAVGRQKDLLAAMELRAIASKRD